MRTRLTVRLYLLRQYASLAMRTPYPDTVSAGALVDKEGDRDAIESECWLKARCAFCLKDNAVCLVVNDSASRTELLLEKCNFGGCSLGQIQRVVLARCVG